MSTIRSVVFLALLCASLPVVTASGTLVTSTQRFTAFDAASNDRFACALAVDGDTLVVGARRDVFLNPGTPGAAYVFVKSGSGWLFQQRLTASDGVPVNAFGADVAISGDTIAVAAPSTSLPGGLGSAGELYVYTRSGTTWTEQQRLFAPTPVFGGYFGSGLAIQGDTLLAGSAYASIPGAGQAGSVFYFLRSGSTWSYQQTLSAAVPHDGDRFGYALSLNGERVAIGAYRDDTTGGGFHEGSVYVFERSAGSWAQTAKLAPSGAHSGDNFGWAVALEGDTLAATAPKDPNATGVDPGAVLVFTLNGSSWIERTRFSAAESSREDLFGYSVALHAGTIVIGAVGRREMSVHQDGAVYAFTGAGATWSETYKLYAGYQTPQAQFGGDVAVQSGRIFVGANGDHDGQGTTFAFDPPSQVGDTVCTGAAPSLCPCGNSGAAFHGCKHSSSPLGLLLFAEGTASVMNDSLKLHGYNLPNNAATVLFQGDASVNAGFGVPNGDGLLCITGHVRRLGVSGGSSFVAYPSFGTSLSVLGMVPAMGATVHYQLMYRDGHPFCTAETFNSSNACKVTWTP